MRVQIKKLIALCLFAVSWAGLCVPFAVAQTGNQSVQSAIETLRKSNALPFPVPMMFNPGIPAGAQHRNPAVPARGARRHDVKRGDAKSVVASSGI